MINRVNGIRTRFQIDRERIVNSKAFRRLKHKTQMIWAPRGDHIRTRLTHTLEVSVLARVIAGNLTPKLDLDLVEAIALAHDLGHTPFGHAGERALNKCLQKHGKSFSHTEQGVITVTEYEPLNLSCEILDGIANHEFIGTSIPKTREGQVVRYTDVIASLNSDYQDIVGLDVEKETDLHDLHVALRHIALVPKARTDAVIKDILKNSEDKEQVSMSSIMEEKINGVIGAYHKFFVANSFSRKDEGAEHVVTRLFDCCMESKTQRKYFGKKVYEKARELGDLKVATSHTAGMTDTYAWTKYCEIFAPLVLDYSW